MKEAIEVELEIYSEEDFDSYINEMSEAIDIMGIGFTPSDVLKEVDPTAYGTEFSNYQRYETVYKCPICGEEYDEDEEAKYCCQDPEEGDE